MEVLVRCWSDYDVVPTSVPVIWLPFMNRNSDKPQTRISDYKRLKVSTKNLEVSEAYFYFNTDKGPPVFDDDQYEEEIKKNRCQFMIPILKMSLMGKKTTWKTL
ncbi:hypothetical protein Tco_0503515 [Tanacetum coccineum]